MGMVDILRFDIILVSLDPSQGSEIQKTRPCLVISPDEMNLTIRTLIVAPMTRTPKNYPSRLSIVFEGTKGSIALDQIRTIDKTRVIKKLGSLDKKNAHQTLKILQTMLAL